LQAFGPILGQRAVLQHEVSEKTGSFCLPCSGTQIAGYSLIYAIGLQGPNRLRQDILV